MALVIDAGRSFVFGADEGETVGVGRVDDSTSAKEDAVNTEGSDLGPAGGINQSARSTNHRES